MKRPILSGLVSALSVACAETSTAPALPTMSQPTSGIAASATGRGAVIERGLYALGWILVDESDGLTSVIGLTATELSDFCLTGNTQPHLAEFMDVIRPNGAVKEVWRGEDAPVLVYSFISFDLCGVLAVTSPQWAGTTDWQGTDNEVIGFGEGPGANSFGFHAHGSVTNLTTSEDLDYQAVVREVVSPTGGFNSAVSDIKLR